MISSTSTVRFSRELRPGALKGKAILPGLGRVLAKRRRRRENQSAILESSHHSNNDHFVMPLSKGG